MKANKTDIFVYTHWVGMPKPKLIGTLSAHQGKGRKSYSFEYDIDYLLGVFDHNRMGALRFNMIQLTKQSGSFWRINWPSLPESKWLNLTFKMLPGSITPFLPGEQDLHQLWRRIIFNIAISNTDDHLRNHGFILKDKGWRLSPAYDINPSDEIIDEVKTAVSGWKTLATHLEIPRSEQQIMASAFRY
ncbi:MAG: HipA domain-containing protein [Bacteroidota bacterium]